MILVQYLPNHFEYLSQIRTTMEKQGLRVVETHLILFFHPRVKHCQYRVTSDQTPCSKI